MGLASREAGERKDSGYRIRGGMDGSRISLGLSWLKSIYKGVWGVGGFVSEHFCVTNTLFVYKPHCLGGG